MGANVEAKHRMFDGVCHYFSRKNDGNKRRLLDFLLFCDEKESCHSLSTVLLKYDPETNINKVYKTNIRNTEWLCKSSEE